jgi:(E)-4-hydroxy-3-methylbut-2-enyl-diphosphate synthase
MTPNILAPAKTAPPATDRFRYARRPTRVVMVGDVPVGGLEPIRIQSMTTSLTWDVEKTVGQIEALVRAGCEIVRVTVPTKQDAEALPAIRELMKKRGVRCPLVADIHFSPTVAMLAVEHVEKIRVNPGNFSDGSKKFTVKEYSDEAYNAELSRMEKLFTPLVLRAKERGISMRIGTNHGSLSDRIVNRFGDSPAGMVESALEFVRICEKLDYRELIISMKASNTLVMVQAYRLLAQKMAEESMDYPFHLGVTEAGDGDDGRIKSAIGIGSLLEDGIGDTIRVSLTEDSTKEIPPAFAIAKRTSDLSARLREAKGERLLSSAPIETLQERVDPFLFSRRKTRRTEQGPKYAAVGGDQPLRVELDLGPVDDASVSTIADLCAKLSGPDAGERRLEVASVSVRTREAVGAFEKLRAEIARRSIDVALDASLFPTVWTDPAARERIARAADRVTPFALGSNVDLTRPLAELAREVSAHEDHALVIGVDSDAGTPRSESADAPAAYARIAEETARLIEVALAETGPHGPPQVVASLFLPLGRSLAQPYRALAAALDARGLDVPIQLVGEVRPREGSRAASAWEDCQIQAALELGSLLVDGIGDSIRVDGLIDPHRAVDLAYGILQGARARTTKTEYISCPSCGRTLFDLETTTAKIKSKTEHLKGVKIGVMGCIVNGPGEMADADFGYVGWKPGKVNLYVGKEVVLREVEEDAAADRLVQLIKDHGRWVDPPAPSSGEAP